MCKCTGIKNILNLISILALFYSKDVELYDYLKEEIGYRVADRVFDIKREFEAGADLGCNRGFLSRHILAESVKHLTLCDMSPTMLSQAKGTPGLVIKKVELDEEEWNVCIRRKKKKQISKDKR